MFDRRSQLALDRLVEHGVPRALAIRALHPKRHATLPDYVFELIYDDHGDRECFISFHVKGTCGKPVQPCSVVVDGYACDLPQDHD
jgi:hypothetical protein